MSSFPPPNGSNGPPPGPPPGGGPDGPGNIDGTSQTSVSMVDAYASLNFAGIVLLSSLILTIFLSRKRRVKRDPCLVNAFLVVVMVNFLNTLYYLQNRSKLTHPQSDSGAGSLTAGNAPHTTLCRGQAILQAGSQAAQAAAVLAVVLRLWLKTIRLSVPWFNKFRRWPTLVFLLALPYLCIIVFIPPVAVLTEAKHNPNYIPVPFYCSFLNHPVKQAARFFSLGISTIALLLEIWVMMMVWLHFRQTHAASRKAGEAMSASFGIDIGVVRPQRSMSSAFFVRVVLFIGWTVAMMATTLFQAFDRDVNDPRSDIAFACIAPMAFFCFASQPDILRAWHIPSTKREWRRLLRLEPALSTSQLTRRKRKAAVPNDESLDLHEFLGNYDADTTICTANPLESVVAGDLESPSGRVVKEDWVEMDLPQFLNDTGDMDVEGSEKGLIPSGQPEPAPTELVVRLERLQRSSQQSERNKDSSDLV